MEKENEKKAIYKNRRNWKIKNERYRGEEYARVGNRKGRERRDEETER